MATQKIRVYREEPFDTSTEIDVNDVFEDITPAEDEFTLSNKTNIRLGATIQVDSTQFYFYNGGYTKSGTFDFTLSENAPEGATVVAPGINAIQMSAFDQEEVEGVDDPRVQEVAFYIGDSEDIHLQKYLKVPSLPGIALVFIDHIAGEGASTTWVQLACATQDEEGTAMTYAASGATLYTEAIQGFATVSGDVSAGATVIECDSSMDLEDFIVGDYLMLNRGNVTQEVVKLLGKTTTTLITTETNYDHYIGETIYSCARKFWAKLTVPEDETGNTAQNYYDVGLRIRGVIESRV